MKGMNDMNNWLGFSLSPAAAHMKMELEAHNINTQPQQQQQLVDHHEEDHHDFYFSSSSSSAPIYGNTTTRDHHHHFQTPLSVMPPHLKSDGSLCIMAEALSRSHPQPQGVVGVVASGSSPKLEDFLGGASASLMESSHEYANTAAAAVIHSRGDDDDDDAINSALFYNNQQQTPFSRQQNDHEYDDQYYYPNNNHVMYQTTNDQYQHQITSNKQPIMDYNYALLQQHQQDLNNNNLQYCLSLSMSSSPTASSSSQISPTTTTTTKKRSAGSQKLLGHKQIVHRKSIDTFGQRTSQYRGVTRHRWTGRYEAHLWDNSCKKEGQTRKGRQVYLGGYDMEEKAARAYDLAALKYWGPSTHINLALENYHQELEEMKNMSRQEYVAHLRRKSSGFSRGASIYRGVTRHHQHGRWQARIGRVAGNKDLYLGTFSTQQEAAEAYDVAAIKFRGANAVTNFDISRYDVEKIMASNTLPTGDVARRNKEEEEKPNINVETACDWIMVQNNQSNGRDHENVTTVGNYDQNHPFSVALHDLVVDESTAPHFSNASSLVTSLSSSREGSPDKYAANNTMSANKLISPPPSNMIGSWIPTAQMRPVPLTTAHLPVFTAWNDT